MKTKIFTTLVVVYLLGGLIHIHSQSVVSERRPRPIPPPCCNPFRTEEVTTPDASAGLFTITLPRLIIADTHAPIGGAPTPRPTATPTPTPVLEPEELAIYRLNLEEYRLTTELQKRKSIITPEEYQKRMAWYTLRVQEFNTVNP